MITPSVLLGPQHLCPQVSDIHSYEQVHLNSIRKVRASFPNLGWRDPWLYAGAPKPMFVSNGACMILCDCGDCPLVHTGWRISRCFTCSAVYTADTLIIPDILPQIEALLVKRPNLTNRCWLIGEELDQLEQENVEHGIV